MTARRGRLLGPERRPAAAPPARGRGRRAGDRARRPAAPGAQRGSRGGGGGDQRGRRPPGRVRHPGPRRRSPTSSCWWRAPSRADGARGAQRRRPAAPRARRAVASPVVWFALAPRRAVARAVTWPRVAARRCATECTAGAGRGEPADAAGAGRGGADALGGAARHNVANALAAVGAAAVLGLPPDAIGRALTPLRRARPATTRAGPTWSSWAVYSSSSTMPTIRMGWPRWGS